MLVEIGLPAPGFTTFPPMKKSVSIIGGMRLSVWNLRGLKLITPLCEEKYIVPSEARMAVCPSTISSRSPS